MKFFQVNTVKIARFFVMHPIFLLCVIMHHNIVDAPIIQNKCNQLFFVMRLMHYDKLNVCTKFHFNF